MVVQVSSVIVPQSMVSVQIENMGSRTIPTCQAAERSVSLCLLRPFVAHDLLVDSMLPHVLASTEKDLARLRMLEGFGNSRNAADHVNKTADKD
jgi:hypothetical protein